MRFALEREEKRNSTLAKSARETNRTNVIATSAISNAKTNTQMRAYAWTGAKKNRVTHWRNNSCSHGKERD